MVIQSPLGGTCHQHPFLNCFRFVPVYIVFVFQPPLFSVQRRKALILSAHQAGIQCQHTWRNARRTLRKSNATYIREPTNAGPLNECIKWATRSGSPPKTFPYGWSPASWPPSLSDLSPKLRFLTQQPYTSSCPAPSKLKKNQMDGCIKYKKQPMVLFPINL